MSLHTLLADTRATLASRRDLQSASTAFAVLHAAATAFEPTASADEFATWAHAGQSAADGRRILEHIVGTVPPPITVQPGGTDNPAQSMAELSSLLSEILADNATEQTDPNVRLGLLAAARHATEIHLLLSN